MQILDAAVQHIYGVNHSQVTNVRHLHLDRAANQVEIFLNLERLAIHPRCRMKTGQRIKIKEHFPPNSDAYYETPPQRLLSQSTQQSYQAAFHRVRRRLGKLGVTVICAAGDEAVPLILERINRLRGVRRSCK